MAQYLFVYGSLRKNRAGRTHPFLANRSRFIGNASIPGKLYRVRNYPGAVPDAIDSRNRVSGEVYQLLQPEKLLPILDDYEECTPRFPPPHEYQRVLNTVTLADNRELNCWVYLYRKPTIRLQRIESGDYFDYLA